MLVKGQIKNQLKTIIVSANSGKKNDLNKAIDEFCEQLEESIFTAIQSITIVIPPGAIITAGTAAAQSNTIPIALSGVIK